MNPSSIYQKNHRRKNGGQPSQKRFGHACLVVGALIAIVAISGLVEDPLSSALIDSPNDRKDPQVSFVAIFDNQAFQDSSDCLPPGFEEEVFASDCFLGVQVSETKNVIAFLDEENPSVSFAMCSSLLEEKGWTKIEGGQAHMASFVKKGGEYTWLFLSCAPVGGETSVLVQLT